jgi:hypothetical protein
MSLYLWLRTLHIAGAFGLFAVFGVEGATLFLLARARGRGEVVLAARGLRLTRLAGPPAMLALLGAGIALLVLEQNGPPFARAGIAAVAAMALIGGIVTGPRTSKLTKAPDLASSLYPVLRASYAIRMGIAVGAGATMTVKPGALGCALVICSGAATGLFVGLRRPGVRAMQT